MKENWFLIGDIHGEAGPIGYFYNQNKDRLKLDDFKNNIILLGDVCCSYYVNSRDKRFKKDLSAYPFTYICLRGNHESRVTDVVAKNQDGWEKVEKYGGWIYIEKEFPNIEYLEDVPAVYEFAGFKTLSIPGAYSVDKWWRLRNNHQWFANEQLTEKEMQYGRDIIKENDGCFDLVISHTCPKIFEPRDLFLASIDQSAVDKTMELYLDEIETSLSYSRWAWGHYHDDRLYPWDGDKEKLMLKNEKVVDLVKYMNMSKKDYLEDIQA